jgi:hypothetical protein
MHDRMWCLHHPLVGLRRSSPVAGGNAKLAISANAARFFANQSMLANRWAGHPGFISKKIKDYWETNFAGANRGRAASGRRPRYQPLAQTAVETELVAQSKATAEMICSTYHVPPQSRRGAIPPQASAEALNRD